MAWVRLLPAAFIKDDSMTENVMYELRDHQTDAIQALRQSFKTGHKRPILQASTGFGKSLVAVDIIKSAMAKGRRVWFVCDRITLIDQISKTFDRYGIDHGVIQADHWRKCPDSLVQVASVQTLTRKKHIDYEVDLIIVDECHSVYSKFVDLINNIDAVPVIGLTATPWTKGLGKIYDDLIIIKDTAWLIENGFLCDYTAFGSTDIDMKGIRTVAGDFNKNQTEKRVNTKVIVGNVVDTWLKRGENRQTVCFAVSVAHSQAIVDEFNANGVPAAHIDAHTDGEERDVIMERHNSGEVKILSNVGITTKGWDSPNTTCLIDAQPTKSLMLHIQKLGRVLRVSECRSSAIILDHGGNIARLGFPTDQLPEYLCNGEKDEITARENQQKEKKEKLPTPCELCNFLSPDFKCPKCGHVPAKVPNVEHTDQKLQKLEKVSQAEKSKWLGMLLGYTRSKGWADGASAHMYKEKFGVWPAKKIGVHAVKPDAEVMGFITHRNIKRAKGAKKSDDKSSGKAPFHPTPEPGYIYSPQKTSAGKIMIRVEKNGKFKGWATQTAAMMKHVGLS